MSWIGKKFPATAVSIVEADGTTTIKSIEDWREGQMAVVYWYPKDKTFVCPTEILEMDEICSDFAERGVKIIGGSVDTAQSHTEWRDMTLAEGGIGAITHALIADDTKALSTELGILNADGLTYRVTFVLDKDGIVRSMMANDLPIGRNAEEVLRIVDGWQFSQENGMVCPAGWRKGQQAIQATTESTAAYLASKHGQTTTKAA